MADDYLDNFIMGLAEALQPLSEALKTRENLSHFLEPLGWSLEPNVDFNLIETKLAAVRTAIDIIAETIENGSPDLFTLGEGFVAIARLVSTDFLNLPAPLNQAEFWRTLPGDVIDLLIYQYIESKSPLLFGTLSIIGVLQEIDFSADLMTGRKAFKRLTVRWRNIPRFFSDPVSLFVEVYGWGNQFAYVLMMQNLSRFLAGIGASAQLYPANDTLLDFYYESDNQFRNNVPQLIASPIQLSTQSNDVAGLVKVMLFVMPVPSRSNRLGEPNGLVVSPYLTGGATAEFELSPKVKLSLRGGFESGLVQILIYPQGIILEFPSNIRTDAEASVSFALNSVVPDDTDKSHIQLSNGSLGLKVNGVSDNLELQFDILLNETILILKFSEGDGFLSKLLPATPIKIPFDFGLLWSNKKGVMFKGGAGLHIDIPVHKTLIDQLTVTLVHLTLDAHTAQSPENGKIALSALVSLRAKLGPFSAGIERVGLLSTVSFPPNQSGNLGILDLGIGFSLPTGIAFKIDKEGITGSGYLGRDPDPTKSEYRGFFELSIKKKIIVKALGIITAGSTDFSMFIVITVEFQGIALGMGFTLVGLGGLIGINRTLLIDGLKAGIKTNAVDSFLFPESPNVNSEAIFNNIQSVFRVADGRFVFGFMAKITWGINEVPALLTIKVGIILEVPSPIRLAIVGQVRSALPTDSAAIIDLKIDIVGYLDTSRGELGVDGSLHDSYILIFNISGDVLIRIRWSAQPVVILSFGGFNPNFVPPPGLPKLERLAISLTSEKNLRVRLESYLAITTNTLQTGANFDLFAKADIFLLGEFSLSAFLGFDALIQFFPFYFIVELRGGVVLKHNGNPLLGIELYLSLEGPNPWHAWGRAEFYIIVKISIPFDVTVGEKEPEPPRPIVDPLAVLMKMIENPQSWTAQLPTLGSAPVLFRTIGKTDALVVNPMGTISLQQRVLPLLQKLDKFGEAKPKYTGPFKITSIKAGTTEILQTGCELKDYFAPAQFFNLTTDEKIGRPSFEQYTCGNYAAPGNVGGSEFGAYSAFDLQYETEVVDNEEVVEQAVGYQPFDLVVQALVPREAAGQAPLRNTGSAQFAGTAQQVAVRDTRFIVTDRTMMSAVTSTQHDTYIDARRELEEYQTANSDLQIVGTYEM